MNPSTPAAKPAPVFSVSAAQLVPPYRHADSGRTVARHQPGEDGDTHLFSATGLFVATVPAGVAATSAAEAAAAVADADAKAKAATDTLHAARVAAQQS